jgi:GT2 family glycosyltransferase
LTTVVSLVKKQKGENPLQVRGANPRSPKVSVIVLNWNGLRFLGPCLKSLMNQNATDYEVILVDNGSTDGSVDYSKENFPAVRVIENGRNFGFGGGNNIGIEQARGEYVIVLNNDTVAPPDFVQTLVEVASPDSSIGSVGCRLVGVDGRPSYGPVHMNHGIVVPWIMGARLSHRIIKLHSLDGWCLANSAAAVLYRKDALQAIGGFDEDFWSDWEDNDLGFRLWIAGYKSVFTAKTTVTHFGEASGSRLSRERNVRIIRNMLSTYFKDYEPSNILTRFFLVFWIIVPARYVLFSVYSLMRIALRQTGHEKNQPIHVPSQAHIALFQAYGEFIRRLPNVMSKRVIVQSHRKVSDSQIFSQTDKNWII